MPSKSIIVLARMTTKGRVTIPKILRDKYGIVPGARLLFERTGDVLTIIFPAKPKRR